MLWSSSIGYWKGVSGSFVRNAHGANVHGNDGGERVPIFAPVAHLHITTEKLKNRSLIILVLGLLTAIGPFAIDMYLPGLDVVAHDLGTTIDRVQLSLTSFFLGIGVGQLIYGPLLDRFGRRPPLIIGLVIFIIASLILATVNTVESLIAYRFVQALGSCAGMVAARALVRDFFPAEETARVFSLLMLILSISPVLAPTLGGHIIHWLGWPWLFVAMGLITLLVLLGVILFIPEKKGPDRTISLLPRAVLGTYGNVFRREPFAAYSIAAALSSAALYAWISGSAFVMMGLHGLDARQFGWAFALLASGIIVTSQTNNLLLRRFTTERITLVASRTQALLGLLLVVLALLDMLSLPVLLIVLYFYLGGMGFVFPNASALAINPFTKLAGSASALLGAVQMGVGVIASYLTSLLFNGTIMPMVLIMAAFSLACWLLVGWKTRAAARPV